MPAVGLKPEVDEHDVFDHYFTVPERRALLDEDWSAGASVSGILLFVLALGLALGVVAVLLTLA